MLNILNLNRVYYGALFFVFIVALFFRLFSIISEGPVSFDEAWSYYVGSQSLLNVFKMSLVDKHPPGFYILMHFWNTFYYSEWWIRVPSFIAAMLNFFIFYLLIKQLNFARIMIIAALALYAIDPGQIKYAAIARMYTLETLFVLVSVYSFIRAIDSYNRKWILVNIVANVFVLSFHHVGAFTIIIEIAFLVYFYFSKNYSQKAIKQFLIYYVPFIFITAGFVIYLYFQIKLGGFAPKWIAEMIGIPDSRSLMFQAALLNTSPFNIEEKLYKDILSYVIFVFIAFGYFTFNDKYKIRFKTDYKIWFLGFLYIAPLVIYWLVSRLMEPVFVYRYFTPYIFLFYILFINAAFSRIFSYFSIIIVIVAFSGSLTFLINQLDNPYKESDWKTKVSIIEENWEDDDLIFVIPHGDLVRIGFYAHQKDKLKYEKVLYEQVFKSRPDPATRQDLEDVFLNWSYPYKRIWFHEETQTGLAVEFYVQKNEGFIYSFLKENFNEEKELSYKDERGRLSLFTLKKEENM